MFENNWESLNTRKVPEWFGEAKFGIFIHWGPYSIPAFAPKGNYAEWYGYFYDMEKPDKPEWTEYKAFHEKHYPGKSYEDFIREFKGERFDAEKWAELFRKSGAKYINIVSKHHDGYCLYDTAFAPNRNAVECAPKRDFLMELKNAMEGTGVRFGVYHSVYEWFHPLYLKNPEEYAIKHLLPMLKEIVEKYQPATLFTDGEWEHESAVWHSTDFLTWLYNESSVKDTIVPNDRWGKETRGRMGGNFTTEYGIIDGGRKIEDVVLDRPFEECRGIGCSFGINKQEGSEDYLTLRELLTTLVSLVSKGGNFLLNIGPDADGTIPPLMEERLLGIGNWLSVNGEAIYGSSVYGESKEECLYYTKKNGTLYAVTTHFPMGELLLPEVPFCEGVTASLLGSQAAIQTENRDGKLLLRIPPLSPDNVKSELLYTFRLNSFTETR